MSIRKTMYRIGSRVIITHGLHHGKHGKVVASNKVGKKVTYDIRIDDRQWPFTIRGDYLRKEQAAPKLKRMASGKLIEFKDKKKSGWREWLSR